MNDLEKISLLQLLPSNLAKIDDIRQAASALDAELQKVTKNIKHCLLYPRLEELSEAEIDLLAWQFHVDFYEPIGMDIETKRKLVKESIAWHRLKGTPAGVEKVLSAAFGKSEVEEWFEYGGEPYRFRIKVSGFNHTKKNTKDIIRAVERTKNTRSRLEDITIDVHPDAKSDVVNMYYGISRGIGGRKQLNYGFGDFEKEVLFASKSGIASVKHGNKVIGGGAEIELNGGLFAVNFNAVSGVRTLEADWPDDLPVPKHEFHFEGHGVLSGGIAYVNAGYRIIDVEIPKDLPKKPTEFHFMDNAGLAGGLVYTVSGMRTIFAEDVTFTHEPVNINIEETGSLYGSAIHVYKGVRTIKTERVDLPVDTEYNVTETATLFKGIIDVRTGGRKLGLESDFKDYEHSLNAGALNIITGTRILKAGIISNDDAVEATAKAGATIFKKGSIKMRFSTGVPDEITTETAAAVYSTTTGIRAGGIETPANMKNSVAYNTLNTAGGFRTIDVDASRAERYMESGKSAVNMKCSTLITINRKYSMKLAGFKETTKYTEGGMMSCNISAGTAVSLYKTYYVSHKEEENNE